MLITVEQAREMSDKTAKTIIDKEVQKILKRIEKTAKKGGYSIVYECKECYCIRATIRDMFKNLGYRAYADSFYPEIKIIWSKEF
jgi:predicted methyltransferase